MGFFFFFLVLERRSIFERNLWKLEGMISLLERGSIWG